MEKNVTTTFSIKDIKIPKSTFVLVLLFCLGCDGLSINQTKIEKLNLDLANSQAELDTLKKELAGVKFWQTRQQKTVNDYAEILMRQGIKNYQDNLEWKKRKQRVESYNSTCNELINKITNLEQLTIPEIKNALREMKGS